MLMSVYTTARGKRARRKLDRSDEKNVISWVKNDHLGFEVLYIFRGVVKKYRPDFLIRLANGVTFVPEVKGQTLLKNKTSCCSSSGSKASTPTADLADWPGMPCLIRRISERFSASSLVPLHCTIAKQVSFLKN